MRELNSLIDDLITRVPPESTPGQEFLEAQFDAGLAWVHHPRGLGGLELPESLQHEVDERLAAAGVPPRSGRQHMIGVGMVSPTLVRFAGAANARAWLRAIWSGAELWCELLSELGAGSDLAGVQTRAERVGDHWEITGEKVWTSLAHTASWGLLLARTDVEASDRSGLTCFVCDVTAPGVHIEPIRQVTGQAEFNRVTFDRAVIPDGHRLGEVGAGWRVVQHTLSSDRATIGVIADSDGAGTATHLVELWKSDAGYRRRAIFDDVVDLWIESQAARLAVRSAQRELAAGGMGLSGIAAKIAVSRSWQRIASIEMEMLGPLGLRYDDWKFRRPDLDAEDSRPAAYRYLRSRGYSIEGGTSEVLLNIIAQRVLGMPK
ncbi:acyl-CoA dehydrogenase family protein [Nocardia niigatensis]